MYFASKLHLYNKQKKFRYMDDNIVRVHFIYTIRILQAQTYVAEYIYRIYNKHIWLKFPQNLEKLTWTTLEYCFDTAPQNKW